MPCLKNFCYCISLRVGGIVMGALTLIAALVIGYQRLIKLLKLFDEKEKKIFLINLGIHTSTKEQVEAEFLEPEVFLGLGIGADILFAISAILLIYGAVKNLKSFVVPYLICGIIYFIFLAVQFSHEFHQIWSSFDKTRKPTEQALQSMNAIFIFVVEIFVIYFLCCVWSLYQYLRDGRHHPQQVMYPAEQPPYNPTIIYSAVSKE